MIIVDYLWWHFNGVKNVVTDSLDIKQILENFNLGSVIFWFSAYN